MKRKLFGAAAVLVLGLVALTPLGPAALAHLLERGVGGWQVSIGGRGGGLLYGFSLSDLRCQNPVLGVAVDVEHLAVRPWSWAVDVQAPKVRIEPVAAADAPAAPADIELPIAFLPNLNATAGALDWQLGETRIVAQDWRGAYRVAADTLAYLELALSDLQGVPLRSLTLELALSPHRIDRGEVRAVGISDSLRAALHASFSLGLKLPRPLQVDAEATVEADSVRGSLAAEIDGALTPLQLGGALRGEGSAPAISAVDLRGRVRADSTRLVLDSLLVSLFDGTLTGAAIYFPGRDSLQAQLRGEGFDLALAAPFAGRAEFDLAAGVHLQHQRYAADFAARLRDVDLIPDQRFDAEIKAWHRPDGATRLDLQSPLLELVATGSSSLEGDYDLALTGAVQAASVLRGAAPVAMAGRAKPDTLALQLTASHLPGELGEEFGPLAADLHLFANRYLAAALRLERDLLVARADIDLGSSEVDTLVAAVNGLALARVMPGLGGRLAANLRGGGELSLNALRLDGRVATTPLEYAGWQSGELALDLGWDRGAARGAGGGPGVSVLAALDAAGHLTARADFADTLLRGANGAVAALDGTLRWDGPLDSLHAAQGGLALDALLLRQGEWTLQNYGPLQADYGDGRMDLAAVQLQTPVGLVGLSGWVGRDSLAVAAEMPALALSNLVPDLSAAGDGHLRVSGTLARPEAQGVVTLAEMRLDTLALGSARLRLALADSLLTEFSADAGVRLALTCPAAPLFGPGEAPARLAIEAVAADLGPVLSYALGRPLHGRLNLDGHLEAALGDSMPSWRDLSGHIDVRGLSIESQATVDSLRLDLLSGGRFALGEGRVVLDSVAIGLRHYDRDRLAVQPAGTLRLAGQLAGEGSQIGLTLEDSGLAFFGGPKGLVQLDAEVRGTASAPQLAVDLAVATADLGQLRGRLVGDRDGGDWHLNWTTLLDDSLTVVGRVPWDLQAGALSLDEGWLEARSDGIGLLFLGDLIAELDHLDGRISADLRAEGLDSTLSLQGQVGVEDLEFALLDLEPIYALPDGHLQFKGRKVELVGFAIEKEPKRGFRSAALTGQLDLAQLDDPSFDLRLQAERLTSYYEDVAQSFKADDIDLELSFAGSISASELAGRIRLDRPRSEASLVVFNAPSVPPPPPALRDEFLENLALAVEVDIRGLTLDSELAEVEASGAVEVGGTFYKPLFQGDITIDEGQVFVLSQKFNITQGRVVFNRLAPTKSILDVMYDPLELNPTLDLQAETEEITDIQDQEKYVVTLTLQGPAQKIVPDFSAASENPDLDPLDDFSIVNLLAFNMANLDYTAAFGSTAAAFNTTAVAFGTAAGQLLSKQVEKVGLNEFTVLPSSTGDPVLRAGKYLDGLPLPLWVRYEALLEEMAAGEVQVEHKIKSFLTIVGSAQSKHDNYGLGIGLKREFR